MWGLEGAEWVSEKRTNPWGHEDGQDTSWNFSTKASLFLAVPPQAGRPDAPLAKRTWLCRSTARHAFILFSSQLHRPEKTSSRGKVSCRHILELKLLQGCCRKAEGNTPKAKASVLYWIYNAENICSSSDICIAIKITLYGIIINGLKRNKQYKRNMADTMKM